MTQSLLSKLTHERRGLWVASVLEVIGLLVFVGIMALVARLVPANGLQGTVLIGIGLIMAVVPAVIWLVFFYQQDYAEPEPKRYIIAVFLLGILVANAVAVPVLERLFRVQDWLYMNTTVQIIGSILVIGVVQEFCKYLAVRYSVYRAPEFDERTDGIIYATAAGLGFATMLNFNYILSNGGVDLGVGAIRIVETTLAHASFAGIMGYFLGQARFERTPVYYLPLGLLLAATLNGLFFFALDRVTTNGLVYTPVNGLLLAAAVAVVTLGAVFFLIRRANRETQALLGANSAPA